MPPKSIVITGNPVAIAYTIAVLAPESIIGINIK